MPSRAKRARSQAARDTTRTRASAGYRALAATEARRARLLGDAAAAAAEQHRALRNDDADAAAAATAAMVAAAVELSAEGMRSELAAVVGMSEGELRRLLRTADKGRRDGR